MSVSPVAGVGIGGIGTMGVGGSATTFLFGAAPKQDFSGFWGGLEYFLTGGIIGDYRYDINGKVTGLAPIAGGPDFIGGPLKKGDKAIKLGRYLVNPKAYHTVKKTFLLKVGYNNFAHIVGKNPDIGFKGFSIVLKGTGAFKGQTYETSFSIVKFIETFF